MWTVRFRMTFALLLVVLALALPGWAQSPEVTFTGLQVSPQINGVNPYGIAIDGTGNIYVTDYTHNLVGVMPAGGGSFAGFSVPGLSYPDGIAVDGNGNLYIGDDNNSRVVKLPTGCGSQPALPITGLSTTINLAVDAANNLYISDGGNNRILKILAADVCVAGGQTVVLATGLSQPQGLAVDITGNIYIADSGNGRVLEVPWTGKGYGSPITVGSGLSYPWDVNLDKSGNVFIADRGNCNVVELPAGGGAQTTVAAFPCGTGGGYRQEAENLAIDGEGDIYTTNHYYSGGWQPPILVLITQTDANFAWESVGQTQTATLDFSFSASTTLSSFTATTEGTPGLDFSVASGGSCATGNVYYAGDTCTVNVNFPPIATGLRTGALLLTDISNAVVGEAFLNGIGTGPAVAFDPGTSTPLPATGLSSPEGTAVDAGGNVYIADSALKSVVKLLWNGTSYGTQTTVGERLSGSAAVAVDGAGNVYIADSTGNTVEKVSAVSGVQTSVGSGLSSPAALAADAYGNLYIADSGNNRVVKLPASGSVQSTVGTGLSGPAGVAIDSIGNIYIADSGNNRVVEVPVNGSAQIKVGTGLSDPHGLAVDAALNVYIVDTGHDRLVMLPFGGSQSILATGLNHPYGVSVDKSGNLYLADTDNKRVSKIDRADAPALSFATTLVGATSSDSPKNVIGRNIGTQALEFNGTVGVVLDAGDVDFYFDTNTGDCVSGTVLNPGTSCPIPTYFNPSKLGKRTGTITLTDNALNATAATQTISLSGVGAAPAPALASLSPSSATAVGAGFTLTVTGSNFVSGSKVEWNGAPLTTTTKYVSATELQVPIPATDIKTPGSFPVTVLNPIPFAGPSNALTFTVDNPVPTIKSLSPTSAAAGAAALTLTINGTNFVSTSTVTYNKAAHTPTYVSSTQFKITLSASDLATPGTYAVVVTNPPPGGGASNKVNFTVTGPVAVVSPTSLALGNQNLGTTSASQPVTLNNTGIAALTITGIATSANFGQTNNCGSSVAASGSCTVNVTFSPTTTGPLTGTLTITDNNNGVAGSTQKVTLSGTGTAPVVSLSPASLSFGSQPTSTRSAARTETVTNTGTGNLSISTVTIGGTNASDFAKSADNCAGTTVTPKGTCTVSVTFTPSATGSRSASLSFTDNASNTPQKVSLSGTGTVPVAVPSPTSLTFPNQNLGTTSASQPVTLNNTGRAALTITGIATSPNFGQTNNCGTSVAGSGSCTINVTFSPTTTGTLTGTLTITDNSNEVAGSTQKVTLSGTGTASVFSPSPPTLSFGNQPISTTSAAQTETVTNTGAGNLTISTVTIGGTNAGDFAKSADTCTGATVTPKKTCTVSVTFTPSATGSHSASLSFTDNASNSPQSVSLSGTGTAPVFSPSSPSLSFGTQPLKSTSAAQTETVTNTGTANLSISTVTIGGTNASDFAKSADTCTGATVTPKGTCTVSVTFTPSATGSRRASLSFTDNASNSPQTVRLNGTGTAPVAVPSPTSLTFGNHNVGTTSAAQMETVTNTGTANLSISTVTIGGTDASDFAKSADNCTGVTVTPNKTCTVSVTFTPSATGSLSASLSFTDNASNSPQAVSLSGTGAAPVAGVSPTSLAFGNRRVGTTSASQPVTLKNTGNAALTITGIATSANFRQTNNCGSSVAASGSCTINVTFSPTTTGTLTGTLTITDNSNGVAGSTQTVSLSGTGTAPVVSLSPPSVNFGNQNINTVSALHTVTLTNTGNLALNITSIALTGPNLSSFFMNETCGGSVAPSASCNIDLFFYPTALGAVTAAVTITDNASGSPQSITLTGTGQ